LIKENNMAEHLTPLQEHWDNKTLNYDLEKYNWPAWALAMVQEVAPKVKELETLHEVLTPAEIVRVGQHVQNACSRKDFMELFDKFTEEYVPQRIQNKRYMIQRQGTLRVVIPQQAKVGRRLAFHQGIFVGNGRGCRTIWTPFTEAKGTNTMWMMDLGISREITKRVLAEKWSLDRFEDECLKHAWPVTLKPGQSHLFFQEHIHGNVNNEEGYTRVSMDMRILIEGEEWGRRLPGGFMRLPGDHEVAEIGDYTGKKFITYAGWNSRFSKDIPLPMQRAIIEPYCLKNKISYNSYEFENEHMDWQPGLEHYIKERPDGIVLCSIYSLTDDADRRTELLNLALDLGVELHFANELCSLKSKSDLEKIQTYLTFAVPKKGLHVWE
jgi:sporadic carbohydrate cluster protein (TIGR04323 family)